jgi:hypothetical protein
MNPNPPQFVWEIPSGMPGQPLVAQLQNQWKVSFFTQGFTQIGIDHPAHSVGTLNITNNTAVWRPSNAIWNSVKAQNGEKKWVVEGILRTTNPLYITGFPSEAFSFEVRP